MTKILYVEDNPDNVYMLTRRLKKKGFELIIAGDGQEGIDKAIEESPDLILMDLSLPTMDGWTATAEIKKIEGVKGRRFLGTASAFDHCGTCRQLHKDPKPVTRLGGTSKTIARFWGNPEFVPASFSPFPRFSQEKRPYFEDLSSKYFF